MRHFRKFGFARFNDETQQGRNCPKLVTNSQKRIFQLFCAATLSCGCETFCRSREAAMEASAHWKFISRNNMSLNCKIGIEREYALLSIDPAHQKSHLGVCAKTNTAVLELLFWTNWHRSPVDPFDVIESLALITGLWYQMLSLFRVINGGKADDHLFIAENGLSCQLKPDDMNYVHQGPLLPRIKVQWRLLRFVSTIRWWPACAGYKPPDAWGPSSTIVSPQIV